LSYRTALSTDQVKWHPLRKMLSERVHTVYSGALSREAAKEGMTNIVVTMLVYFCVSACSICACGLAKKISRQMAQYKCLRAQGENISSRGALGRRFREPKGKKRDHRTKKRVHETKRSIGRTHRQYGNRECFYR